MALQYNGETVKKVNYNGNSLKALEYNGVVVWSAEIDLMEELSSEDDWTTSFDGSEGDTKHKFIVSSDSIFIRSGQANASTAITYTVTHQATSVSTFDLSMYSTLNVTAIRTGNAEHCYGQVRILANDGSTVLKEFGIDVSDTAKSYEFDVSDITDSNCYINLYTTGASHGGTAWWSYVTDLTITAMKLD